MGFILSASPEAPQVPWYELSQIPRTWLKQDNSRVAVQSYQGSLQDLGYCTQALSVRKDCKPAFAFWSSQLLWYLEPCNKILLWSGSCVHTQALCLCTWRGTVRVTGASGVHLFWGTWKKGVWKVHMFKTHEQNKNISEASDLCRWGKAVNEEFTCGSAVEEYCPPSSQHRQQPHLLAHSRGYKRQNSCRIIQTLLLTVVRKHGARWVDVILVLLVVALPHRWVQSLPEEHQNL